MNRLKAKKWIKRAASLLFCGAMLLPMLCVGADAAPADSGDVVSGVVDGQVAIFKWTPIINAEDFPKGDHYVTMLTEKYRTVRGSNILYKNDGQGKITVSDNYTPYNYTDNGRKSTDIFYTVGSMGAPMFHHTGSHDGDNDCYKFSIWLTENDYPYSPLAAVNKDGDNLKSTPGYSLNSVADGIKYYCEDKDFYNLGKYDDYVNFWSVPNYKGSASSWPGDFCIIRNISNSRDLRWKSDSDTALRCNKDKDWGDGVEINLWYGDPTMYSALTQSYTVNNGQTLNLNAEEGFAGVYIPKNVTLTVEKGGTLSINETVFNDGTIINNGGTVLIQSKGRVSPFASDALNKIVVKNDGALIIMEGGALYTSADTPMILAQSRLINFGTYVMGGNLFLYSSFVENRKSGVILADLNFDSTLYANFGGAEISVAGVSGMTSTTQSKIYLYDTPEHYGAYGCMNGDGSLVNFDMVNDVYWFSRSAADLKDLVASI